MALARAKNKPVRFSKSGNATFSYTAGTQKRNVWILDAASAFNQVASATGLKPRGYALWRVGAEDPKLWRVLPNRDRLNGDVAESLEGPGRKIDYDAERELISRQHVTP